MTKVEQGKFCAACSKQVIDFTLMSDQQILNYFSKASEGNTCGRFANDQLQRPLIPMHHDKKKSWWAAAAMPLLLFFNKTYSQGKPQLKQDTTVHCTKDELIMGKVSRPVLQGEVIPVINTDTYPETIQVKGKVTDEQGEPITHAFITLDKESNTTSDENGNFELNIPNRRNFRTILFISSIGYYSQGIPISIERKGAKSKNVLIIEPILLQAESYTEITAGVIDYVEKPQSTVVDTIKKSILNLIREKEITIYPNPITVGRVLHMQVNKAGDYSVAIFNTQGKLLITKEYNAANDFFATEMPLPDMLSPGIYYIQFTNKKTKKQSSEKMIVQ